jgi:hypothetical protein
MELVIQHQWAYSQRGGRLGGNYQRDERIDRVQPGCHADVVRRIELFVTKCLDLLGSDSQLACIVKWPSLSGEPEWS